MTKRITIVNDQDEIIGYKERDTVAIDDIYRVSALCVKNAQGDILLAQRSFTKKHHPGKWGPAAAGTVEEGESYDDNMIKEAEEELGLKNIEPQKLEKIRVTPAIGAHNHFTQHYVLVINKPAKDFIGQKEEVEQVKWFKHDELEKELREHPEPFLKNLHWVLEI